MIDAKFLDALRKIYSRLSNTATSWVVTGSLALVLQGVPIRPHDIDIQTDKKGAYEIERLFSEFVTRPVEFSATDKIRSHFGALLIDGIKVEIMGDVQKRLSDGSWEKPVNLKQHKRFVEVEGMQIPVLSLKYECQAYRKLGRTKKAELLEKWLKTNKSHL